MGFILAWSEDLGIGVGGKCIPGPTFQGLVVVFPVVNEAEKKKRSSVLTGPGHQCNCCFPFRFLFHVSGMVWIIFQSVICPFHGCLRPTASSHPHLLPCLQLSLYNWILRRRLPRVRHTSLWQLPLVYCRSFSTIQFCKITILCSCVYLPE